LDEGGAHIKGILAPHVQPAAAMDPGTEIAEPVKRPFHVLICRSIDERTDEGVGIQRVADPYPVIGRLEPGHQFVINLIMDEKPPRGGTALAAGADRAKEDR